MIIIVDVETVYDYPWFPPVEIVAARYLDGTYFNYVNSSVPNDGVYSSAVYGVWRMKYKTIVPHYYCEGQGLKGASGRSIKTQASSYCASTNGV